MPSAQTGAVRDGVILGGHRRTDRAGGVIVTTNLPFSMRPRWAKSDYQKEPDQADERTDLRWFLSTKSNSLRKIKASVASLRWCSPSARNVRLPSGMVFSFAGTPQPVSAVDDMVILRRSPDVKRIQLATDVLFSHRSTFARVTPVGGKPPSSENSSPGGMPICSAACERLRLSAERLSRSRVAIADSERSGRRPMLAYWSVINSGGSINMV